MTVAVAAYRRRKQRIKNTNQLALVLGLLDEEDAVVSQKISVASATCCVVQQLRLRYILLLDAAVGGRLNSKYSLHGTLWPSRCMWVCKPQTIGDHVLYHATVVCRCTRSCAYPQQQSFAVYCGRRRAPDGRTDAKVQIRLKTQTSRRLETGMTGMDDCVATVTAAVAVYIDAACKESKISISWRSFWGLFHVEDAINRDSRTHL